jgi:hypothetical protein
MMVLATAAPGSRRMRMVLTAASEPRSSRRRAC